MKTNESNTASTGDVITNDLRVSCLDSFIEMCSGEVEKRMNFPREFPNLFASMTDETIGDIRRITITSTPVSYMRTHYITKAKTVPERRFYIGQWASYIEMFSDLLKVRPIEVEKDDIITVTWDLKNDK